MRSAGIVTVHQYLRFSEKENGLFNADGDLLH